MFFFSFPACPDSDKTKSQRSNSHLTAEIPEKIQRVTHNGTPDVSLERPEQRARGIYRADNSLPSESGTKSELVTIHMEEQSSVKPQPKSEVPSVSESPPKNPDPQEWPTSGLSSEVADAEISSPPEEKPVLPVEKPHERMDCEETGTVKQGRKKSHKCGVFFKSAAMLRKHLRTHCKARPHGCQQCMKRFPYASDLKRHMLIHSRKKPFSCPHCDLPFTRLSHFQRHKKVNASGNSHPKSLWVRIMQFPPTRTGHLDIHWRGRMVISIHGSCIFGLNFNSPHTILI
uniref:C2H2-type domain-containing protein n=1 Tax=Erpetoichthys calabaricus TaxID=27687 RepID=A0A8C4TJ12_ERPCA